MGDLFEELAKVDAGYDPVERARANLKRVLPKRFYREVSAAPRDGLYHLLLDGRPVRTPARNELTTDDLRVACALEAEWAGQGECVDPALMPLTRLVNSAIDGVAGEIEAVKEGIVAFAESDQTLYRAEAPERLVARQRAAWDPLIAWAGERLGVTLRLAVGVTHVEQPAPLAPALRAALPDRPLALAAFHAATTLTGSALLALALCERYLDADAVWAAAHVDEDWNAELWGLDAEAASRLAFRRAEFDAAALALGV